MECVECETSVQRPAVVTFVTGKVEVLALCTDCAGEYREGEFVDAVSAETPTTGGEPQKIVKCSDCGEVYPAQTTAEGTLRPVGQKAGRCSCGNSEFRPLVER